MSQHNWLNHYRGRNDVQVKSSAEAEAGPRVIYNVCQSQAASTAFRRSSLAARRSRRCCCKSASPGWLHVNASDLEIQDKQQNVADVTVTVSAGPLPLLGNLAQVLRLSEKARSWATDGSSCALHAARVVQGGIWALMSSPQRPPGQASMPIGPWQTWQGGHERAAASTWQIHATRKAQLPP